jgi:hypothetical protein
MTRLDQQGPQVVVDPLFTAATVDVQCESSGGKKEKEEEEEDKNCQDTVNQAQSVPCPPLCLPPASPLTKISLASAGSSSKAYKWPIALVAHKRNYSQNPTVSSCAMYLIDKTWR